MTDIKLFCAEDQIQLFKHHVPRNIQNGIIQKKKEEKSR